VFSVVVGHHNYKCHFFSLSLWWAALDLPADGAIPCPGYPSSQHQKAAAVIAGDTSGVKRPAEDGDQPEDDSQGQYLEMQHGGTALISQWVGATCGRWEVCRRGPFFFEVV
jgi:hypothetical protein